MTAILRRPRFIFTRVSQAKAPVLSAPAASARKQKTLVAHLQFTYLLPIILLKFVFITFSLFKGSAITDAPLLVSISGVCLKNTSPFGKTYVLIIVFGVHVTEKCETVTRQSNEIKFVRL